jgi:hypothetical protein
VLGTSRVSVFKLIRMGLEAMNAARILNDNPNKGRLTVFNLVEKELGKLINLLNQTFIHHPAFAGTLGDELRKMPVNPLENKRGLVLMSHVTHPHTGLGCYAICFTQTERNWIVVVERYRDSGFYYRQDDATMLLTFIQAEPEIVKIFLLACKEAVDRLVQVRISQLQQAQADCALDVLYDSFEQSHLQHMAGHVSRLQKQD